MAGLVVGPNGTNIALYSLRRVTQMDRYHAARIPSYDSNGVYQGTIETPCVSFMDAYRMADNFRVALLEALGAPDELVKVSVHYAGNSRIVEVAIDR